MILGVCRVEFAVPENASLKGKRAVVRKLVERARSRFAVSIAEVDALDNPRRAVLGFAVVSNDGRHASEMRDKVLEFLSGATEAFVVDQKARLLTFEPGDAEPSFFTRASDDVLP